MKTRSSPRRYELRPPELNTFLEELLRNAQREWGKDPNAELVRETVVSTLRLLQDHAARGDLKLINHALKELRHALHVFSPWQRTRKVSVFGSARTPPGTPAWNQAHAFAERIVAAGWMVITGAGDGVMGAAQGGAGRERSFGVNIRLPFEQAANRVIRGDTKLINFRYFFTRKLMFVKNSHAIVLLPGGFGTHDEGFESLTLVQTGKGEIVPIVFLDAPGGDTWREWDRYVRTRLQDRGLIGPHDTALYKVTDRVDETVQEILNFYSNYHSSRYVNGRFVMRLRRAPDEAQLEALHRDFEDILVPGTRMDVSVSLPEENGEMPSLPRLVLDFNRRDTGRLRELIDRVNEYVPDVASPPEQALPREIVPSRFSPEAEHLEREG